MNPMGCQKGACWSYLHYTPEPVTQPLKPVRAGQVILHNGFEPYQHRDWYSQADVEPGMVKWLHMAAGYGYLKTAPGAGSR